MIEVIFEKRALDESGPEKIDDSLPKKGQYKQKRGVARRCRVVTDS